MRKIYKIALCVLCAHASSALAADFTALNDAVEGLSEPVNKLVKGYTAQQTQITQQAQEAQEALKKAQAAQAAQAALQNEKEDTDKQISTIAESINTLTQTVNAALEPQQS